MVYTTTEVEIEKNESSEAHHCELFCNSKRCISLNPIQRVETLPISYEWRNFLPSGHEVPDFGSRFLHPLHAGDIDLRMRHNIPIRTQTSGG